MAELVYQCLEYDHTPQQAAAEFAQRFFDKPREVRDFKSAECFRFPQFGLVDGIATYEIRYVMAVPGKSSAIWQVWRL